MRLLGLSFPNGNCQANSRVYIKSFKIMKPKVRTFMNKSIENLKAAFAGESQANRRYLAFAQKAEEEGHPQVAKLFKAAAEAETVHAMNHTRTMGEIRTTAENLNTAVGGETFEFRQMYPEYINIAKQEKNTQAIWSFNVANQVEKIHANLFTKAINALKTGREPQKAEYYVCNVCGNTVENEPPEKCPICGSPKSKFFKVA